MTMKTIILEHSPDDYRGDLDAIDIITPNTRESLNDGSFPLMEEILVTGEPAGILLTYFGNSGKSWKIASQEFHPMPGWNVVYR